MLECSVRVQFYQCFYLHFQEVELSPAHRTCQLGSDRSGIFITPHFVIGISYTFFMKYIKMSEMNDIANYSKYQNIVYHCPLVLVFHNRIKIINYVSSLQQLGGVGPVDKSPSTD